MRAVLIAVGWVVALWSVEAGAQPIETHWFDRYSVEQGLSADPITALLQDRQGFLWIGTLDGLNRFDGYGFDVFHAAPDDTAGLAHGWVNYGALYEHAGALWVGTRGGLSRYDPGSGRFRTFRHAPGDTASLIDDNVTALAATDPRSLWVGTARGLGRLDLRSGRFTRYVGTAADAPGAYLVTALYVDADGTLWIGTRHGLHRYDPRRDRFTRPLKAAGTAVGYVHAIEPGRDGRLWIGTDSDGLLRLEPATGDVMAYRHDARDPAGLPSDQVLSLEHDGGALWVGTWGHGLCRLHEAEGSFTCDSNRLGDERSLPNDLVSSLLSDRAGNLFVGTWDGLAQLAARKPFWAYGHDAQRPDSSLAHPRVGAVYEDDDGVLWVGTHGGGLDRLDRTTGAVTHFRHDPADPSSLAHDEVRSITEYAGDLWVGTSGGGVSRLDRRAGTFTHYRHDPGDPHSLGSDLVYTTYRDPRDTLWVSTVTRGLFRYVPARDGFAAYRARRGDTTRLAHNSVWPLQAQGDTLWVGTVGGGLDALDRRTGTVVHHRHDPSDAYSLSHDQVISLALDGDGALWVGTLGAGLNRYDAATGRFRRYLPADGLPHHSIACIVPDGDALWVGTSRGLARLDLRDDTFARFGVDDGLPSATFRGGACAKSRRGELLFGTDDGLVAFHPDHIRLSDYQPPVVITEVELFNQPLPLGTAAGMRSLTLPHDSNFVAFRFAALDFTAPAQNRYAYRLDGIDADWVEAGPRRYAGYPDLAPGSYTFRVRGTNSDGVWSDEEAALRLVVRRPFWQTWWFIGLVLVVLAVVVLVLHRYRVYHLLRVEQVRRRIAQDLHDDLGSEIGSLAFSLELAGRSEELDRAKRRELLGLSERAYGAAESIREITWVVDVCNDTLQDLVDRMHEVTYQLFPDGRARFEAPATVPPVRLPMEVRQHVYLIFKEALHNAARHAGARRVLVRVQYVEEVLTLRVLDDGTGFDVEQVRRGDGLDNLQARAERIGGDLTFDSRPGHGTTVTLRVRIA